MSLWLFQRNIQSNAESLQKVKSRSGLPLTGKVLFIDAHETGNNSADADDHFTYFNRHVIASSAHTFIDDTKILELLPLTEKAWHVQFQKLWITSCLAMTQMIEQSE
ncbi:N-acetylmuramoyl-L-alanine amidase [Bacillus gobiensis]|uniref:N-acetylmuramoyl-L-alanine amidase n=1 Tax=Bacillus gobiensis TaxID=1441095 RepID=UPI003D195E9C